MPGDFSYRGGASANPQFDQSTLLLEDCEGTYKWLNSGTGADYVGLFDASFCYFGTKGWKLRTRATTPAADDIVTAGRPLTFPMVRRLIVRGRVNFSDVSLVKALYCQLAVYDGVRGYPATLRFRPNTPDVCYLNSAGVYVAIPALAVVVGDLNWYMFEMAIDLVSLKYVYARFGGIEADLSGLAIQDAGAFAARSVQLTFDMTAIGAAQAEVGMDSVYVGAHDQL